MPLNYESITATQKYTAPPPRYTEASLVKKLEELGIGRPSTYAPTISTIQNRGYVSREDRPGEKRMLKIVSLLKGKITASTKTEIAGKEKSKLFPQDIGMIVNDFLIENFSEIVDYHFTAEVEEQFDEIALGNIKWTGMIEKFYSPFHKTVTNTLEKKERKTGVRVLGDHPETGEPITVRMGRFGPVAQIGDSGNDEKPRFASLSKNQLLETITLDEALNLFRLPRSLGEYEDGDMIIGIGKFGPYVRYKSKFFSLKKGVDDPYTITFERAVEIILEKNESDKKKIIRDFGDFMLLNGRYGPYLVKDKLNYRLPKGTDAEKLTKEECIKIIENSDKTKKSS
jgi:DNA topoisomerase-1